MHILVYYMGKSSTKTKKSHSRFEKRDSKFNILIDQTNFIYNHFYQRHQFVRNKDHTFMFLPTHTLYYLWFYGYITVKITNKEFHILKKC